MILSDRDIKEYIKAGKLVVKPIEPEVQIQPSSIDLRLGNQFKVFRHISKGYIDPMVNNIEQYTEDILIENEDKFILHPGEFVLSTIKEWIEIPDDLVARIEGRSSLGRMALLIHATAGFIDPGFKGNITLELSNVGKMPIALHPNMRICQLALEKLSSPCERPYGHPTRESKYQMQRGATSSKIHLDREFKINGD